MSRQRALLGFLTTLFLILSLCSCDKEPLEVVGMVECVDCTRHNIEHSHTFSGLHVAIVCKVANGKFKTTVVGELTEDGKFKVRLPSKMVKEDGVSKVQLMKKCYAQLLHNATGAPCPIPTHLGVKAHKSKIIFKSTNNGKDTFGPAGKLLFSPITCTSPTNSKIPKPMIRLLGQGPSPNRQCLGANRPVKHPPHQGRKPRFIPQSHLHTPPLPPCTSHFCSP